MRARLAREPVLAALLVFAGAQFVYRWLFDNNRPHGGSLGWHAFHDQGLYYREAASLAHLHAVPVKDFFYGPGYPVLAAPFARVGALGFPSGDSFFFADLAIWLLTIATTFLVGRRLYGDWFGLACALALALATPLLDHVVTPWNTSATLAALMLTLLVALAPRLGWRHGIVLGLALVLAYSARYVDVVWVAIAVAAVLLARGALSWRAEAALATVAAAWVAVLPVLWLHWHAFGDPFAASYRKLPANRVGSGEFQAGNIVHHGLSAFVSPFYFSDNGYRDPGGRPLLMTMFLVVLAPLGFVLFVRRHRGPRRTLAVGYGLATVAATIFYLAYYFTGSYGLHFGSIHYFTLCWPLWTVGAGAAVYLTVERLSGVRADERAHGRVVDAD